MMVIWRTMESGNTREKLVTQNRWNKYLNVRPETIKLLEENIGRTLNDGNQSEILYDPPLRVTETETKVNKWDLIKLLHSKGYHKQGEKTTLRMGENNSK